LPLTITYYLLLITFIYAPLRGIYENLKNIKTQKDNTQRIERNCLLPVVFYIPRYSFNITSPCFANSDFQFFYSATGWAFIKHTLTRMHLSRYNRNSIEYFRILPLDILQIFSYSAAGWAFKKNIIGKGNNKRQCLRASSRHLRKFKEYRKAKRQFKELSWKKARSYRS
jgi:hypothetical protein